LPQLQAIYDKRWPSFLANAGMSQFFTPVDMETAEYIQRRGGFRTEQRTSTTYDTGLFRSARSEQIGEMRTPLLPPEETMSMTGQEQIVFFAGKHATHRAPRKEYWEIERLKGLWNDDPYHTP
jgi:type IV secretion system protein VirD4